MEGARTSDTRRRFKSIFPNPRAVPCPLRSGPELTTGLKLFDEDRRVILFLDGYRSFQEIIAVSKESESTVFQTCLTLREEGRLEVIEPEQVLSAISMKSGFFRKARHVEISADLEIGWSSQGPSRTNPIQRVRLAWPGGSSVEPVQFVGQGNYKIVAVPKELMQAWGISEGSPLSVSPAP